jgi:hypothetical protein
VLEGRLDEMMKQVEVLQRKRCREAALSCAGCLPLDWRTFRQGENGVDDVVSRFSRNAAHDSISQPLPFLFLTLGSCQPNVLRASHGGPKPSD